MTHYSRRSLLLAALASATPAFSSRAKSPVPEAMERVFPEAPTRALPEMPKALPKEPKRAFVVRANEQWRREYELAQTKLKSPSDTGRLASLVPPQELVPFKDWDFYYTKGRPAVWSPNAGQQYKLVEVPTGFVTDLASVPQWAWSSGVRPEGPYAYAAIVHDYLYWMQERPRAEADAIFLIAMEDSKVAPGLRKRIYDAVRLGGRSAWDRNAKLKGKGEKRLLRQYPNDFTISWSDWKRRPGVFLD